MKTTLEILEEAYELLGDPKRWTIESYARDVHDSEAQISANDAVKFCAIGAISRVAMHEHSAHARNAAWDMLDEAARRIYDLSIVNVNDSLGRRQVRAVYRAAIRRAKEEAR